MHATTSKPNPAATPMPAGSGTLSHWSFRPSPWGRKRTALTSRRCRSCGAYDTDAAHRQYAGAHQVGARDGAVRDTDDLMGLGTRDERMLILVDIDKLMLSADMGLIEELAV